MPVPCENPCNSKKDCPGGQVCWVEMQPDGEWAGHCGPAMGALPTGAECDERADPNELPFEERCEAFYCIRGHCSAVCTATEDCPQYMECALQWFCLQEPCDDPANLASVPMCLWMDCCLDPCRRDADCAGDQVCNFYVTPDGEVERACTSEVCSAGDACCALPGEPCGPEACPCRTGLCLDGLCSAICTGDEDCPARLGCKTHVLPGGGELDVCLP